jgi:hypothetical protein
MTGEFPAVGEQGFRRDTHLAFVGVNLDTVFDKPLYPPIVLLILRVFDDLPADGTQVYRLADESVATETSQAQHRNERDLLTAFELPVLQSSAWTGC